MHPEDRARAGREIELMLSGASDGCTNRLATRAGGWRHVEWTARVAPDVQRIYAVVRDVTDRNAMQDALAAGEARYRTLVHSIPNSAVLTFDHDLRFTFAAGAILAQAGVETLVVGRTLAEAFPDLAATLTPRYRAALGGHAQSFELPMDGATTSGCRSRRCATATARSRAAWCSRRTSRRRRRPSASWRRPRSASAPRSTRRRSAWA